LNALFNTGVILVQKKILNIFAGGQGDPHKVTLWVQGKVLVGVTGCKAPGRFRHFRWLRVPLNYALTRNALLTLLSTHT